MLVVQPLFLTQVASVAKQWAGVANFVGLCHDHDVWPQFLAHLVKTDEQKVWTWSCFREHTTNLQRNYCVSLIEWAISPRTTVCHTNVPVCQTGVRSCTTLSNQVGYA